MIALTARHTRSLAILGVGAVLTDLTDDAVLSPEMIINNL